MPNVRGRDAIFFGADLLTGGATGLLIAAGGLDAPTEYFLTATIGGVVAASVSKYIWRVSLYTLMQSHEGREWYIGSSAL
jgi:hypothetical protein